MSLNWDFILCHTCYSTDSNLNNMLNKFIIWNLFRTNLWHLPLGFLSSQATSGRCFQPISHTFQKKLKINLVHGTCIKYKGEGETFGRNQAYNVSSDLSN